MNKVNFIFEGKEVEVFIGQKINRLEILDLFYEKYTLCCKCKCECGIIIEKVVVRSLFSGNTKSCGCLQREIAVDYNTKHGQREERIYSIWRNMRNRCRNSNIPNFGDYGGRGISVCEEWANDFMSFYNWSMENGYSDELSLDRKDNNGCYCPENCHWVTQFEQANNKRNNRYIQHNGEIHTVAEWGRITGIGQGTILRRLKLGWDADKILTTPVRKKAR